MMRQIKTTLINLWPEGGMLHYTAQLSAALSKQKNLSLTVILPRGADSSLFSSETSIRFVDIPSEATLTNLLLLATGLPFIKLYKAIKDTKPDIIHLNSSHVLMLLVLPLLAKKLRTVATIHDATSHPGSDSNLRKHLERQVVVNSAEYFFMHRDVIRQQFLDLNPRITKEKVLITPHGDYDFFKSSDEQQQEEVATLLFFGRISKYKGLIHLVEAVELIRYAHPELRIIIAGNGDLDPQVRSSINDDIYEVHNRFIGDDEVEVLFNRATILVLPYIEASESGVIQIGKAFNKPIISTDVGGIPEAVMDGKTGIIVQPGDTDELAGAIDKLLSDANLRQTFKDNIKTENDSRPGWDDASEIIMSTYRSIIDSKHSSDDPQTL